MKDVRQSLYSCQTNLLKTRVINVKRTIKRIYEPAQENDGLRILVDRLWPRGISKARAHLDEWMKSVAPSSELRKQFNHKPERFAEFERAYRREFAEDKEKQQAAAQLIGWSHTQNVTLLYAAKDPDCNHALVLLRYLDEKEASEQL